MRQHASPMSGRWALILACGASVSAVAGPVDGTYQPAEADEVWHALVGSMRESWNPRLMWYLGGQEGWEKLRQETVLPLVEQFFQLNDWTGESDAFSLDLFRQVSAIAPWEPEAQQAMIADRLAHRYQLDEQQESALRALIERTSDRILARSGYLMVTALGTTAFAIRMNQPAPLEDPAAWWEAAQAILGDARKELNLAADEFLTTLTPEQQELATADLAAANARLDRTDGWFQYWREIGWDLDLSRLNEPYVSGQPDAPTSSPAGLEDPTGGDRPTPGPIHPLASRPAEDEWAAYVREFIARHRLDDAQQRRAWLIFEYARRQRDLAAKHREALTARLNRAVGASPDELDDRVALVERRYQATRDSAFKSMQRRLDRLPTRAQRSAAGGPEPKPAPIPVPVPPQLGGP